MAYVYPDRAGKLYRTPDSLYQNQMKKSLMETAMIRGDKWGLEVAGRLSGIIDLVSEKKKKHYIIFDAHVTSLALLRSLR